MDEALALAFPGAKVERTTAYLTEQQTKAITKASGSTFSPRLVYPYVAKKDGKILGTAYFDTHTVRSMKETLMVVIGPEGTIQRVELLAFGEPRQYLPKPKWYLQIHGLKLSEDLKLGGKIRSMSGATLTAKATVDCSRRMLALHKELAAAEPKPKETPDSEDPKDKPAKKPIGKDPAEKPATDGKEKPVTQASSESSKGGASKPEPDREGNFGQKRMFADRRP